MCSSHHISCKLASEFSGRQQKNIIQKQLKMFLVKSLFIVSYVIVSISGDCKQCTQQKHYQELNCRPIKDKPDDCCPSRYECKDFTALDRTKCHLNDKVYDLAAEISNNLPTCTKSCECDGAEDEFGFSCKFDECPEARTLPIPNCAYQFTIDSCCSTNTVCDPKEIEKLPRCWMDGHEFVKGNLIYSPSAPCFKCLCDEKFSNATDFSQNSNCKPVDCGIELHQLSYLQLGCAPVYFDDGLCCPFEFRCPTENDTIVAASKKTVKSEHTCRYGNLTLNVGEVIQTDEPCMECFCKIPPMAQCVRSITTEKCH